MPAGGDGNVETSCFSPSLFVFSSGMVDGSEVCIYACRISVVVLKMMLNTRCSQDFRLCPAALQERVCDPQILVLEFPSGFQPEFLSVVWSEMPP